jgi:hypothetical protein
MDISQDIWSCKIRYLPVCVYLICLLKSIKKLKTKINTELKTLCKAKHIRNII